MAKNDYTSKKSKKKWAESWNKIRFFADSTDKWLIYFLLHFGTIQQMQVILHFGVYPAGWLDESFFRPFLPLIFWYPYFEVA